MVLYKYGNAVTKREKTMTNKIRISFDRAETEICGTDPRTWVWLNGAIVAMLDTEQAKRFFKNVEYSKYLEHFRATL